MKIRSSFESKINNKTSQTFKGLSATTKYVPNCFAKAAQVAEKYISTPEQKLILTLSSLLFLPLIDLKFANEDKKIDAAIKSTAKPIACGFTGVLIRKAFIEFANKTINFNKNNIIKNNFMPQALQELSKQDMSKTVKMLEQYNTTLGTIVAMLFMICFSNVKIDVPLTGDLQDIISGVVKGNKGWLKSINDVKKNRIQKIKNKANHRKQLFNNIKTKVTQIYNEIKEDRFNKKAGGEG